MPKSLSATQYRPFLGRLETYRCQQVAVSESKTLSQAARDLINDGWLARTGETVTRLPKKAEAIPAKRMVHGWLKPHRAEEVERLARSENRSIASMVDVLIRESLAARRIIASLAA
jgi:hypothetical protein